MATFGAKNLTGGSYYTTSSPAIAQQFVAEQPYINFIELRSMLPEDPAARYGGTVVIYETEDFLEHGFQGPAIYGEGFMLYSGSTCVDNNLPDFVSQNDCVGAIGDDFTTSVWLHKTVPLTVGSSYTLLFYFMSDIHILASEGDAYPAGKLFKMNLDTENGTSNLVREEIPDTDLWFQLGFLTDPLTREEQNDFRIKGKLVSVSPIGTPEMSVTALQPGDDFEAVLTVGFDAVEVMQNGEGKRYKPVQSTRLELSIGNVFFEFQNGFVDVKNDAADSVSFLLGNMLYSSLGRASYLNVAALNLRDNTGNSLTSDAYSELFNINDFKRDNSELVVQLVEKGSGDLEAGFTITDGYTLLLSIDSINSSPAHTYSAKFELNSAVTNFSARAVAFDEMVNAGWRLLAADSVHNETGEGEVFNSPYIYRGINEVELTLFNDDFSRTSRQWFTYWDTISKPQHPTLVTQSKDIDGNGTTDEFYVLPNQLELAASETGRAFAAVNITESDFFSTAGRYPELYLEAELLSAGSPDSRVDVWLRKYYTDNGEM